ncbi:MAG TPA: HAD family hydrolase [Dehalococcoidia bacterium]|nr:HAD family hydrolase [Dehalococcoidia bacterium]
MTDANPIQDAVILFDVDNTLLDNDAVQQDLRDHLTQTFGAERQERYWQILEELRAELGYVDYLGALQRYRVEHQSDPHLLEISLYLVSYPFASRVYPGALAAIQLAQSWGQVAILSDGDVVFQPHKVERSGLWRAVHGNVLIYIHKEQMLADVHERYPAEHYVMVDDKLHILAAMKRAWGANLTTVFPKQGHYAYDTHILASSPPADIQIDAIGDLAAFDLNQLVSAASAP